MSPYPLRDLRIRCRVIFGQRTGFSGSKRNVCEPAFVFLLSFLRVLCYAAVVGVVVREFSVRFLCELMHRIGRTSDQDLDICVMKA